MRKQGLGDDISTSAVANIAGRKELIRGRKKRVDELLKRESKRKHGSDEKSKIAGAT